jgi:hypothetical protein
MVAEDAALSVEESDVEGNDARVADLILEREREAGHRQ